MRAYALTAAAALVMAAPATAQQHGQHGQQQHGQHQQGAAAMQGGHSCMAMMGGPAPAMVLQHGEHLELSEEQVSRLETLRDGAQQEAMPHMQQGMEAHKRAAAALEGDQPDLAAHEAALREAADHMVQAHTAMARTAVATREVLTADQREQLGTMMKDMHGKMKDGAAGQQGGTQHGGMQHGGMQHGAMQHGEGGMPMGGCMMMMGGMQHGAGHH